MPHTTRVASPTGFTLVEVIVAILLLTIALLTLEGSASVTVRELAEGQRETLATRLAERQRERAFGTACAAFTGVDSGNGVTANWAVTLTGQRVRLTQHTSFETRSGPRRESYDAVGLCR